jgi:hypothetical protein
MPAEAVLSKTAYEGLLKSVGKMLVEARDAGRDADGELARVYWRIGDRLLEEGLESTSMWWDDYQKIWK